MTDISPESVKAFVEKWDAPARHTDVRMTDSPPTPFGEAMLMLTALSAERDALKATVARLCEAYKPFAEFADALTDDAPDDIALGLYCNGASIFGPNGGASIGSLRAARAALAAARETLK